MSTNTLEAIINNYSDESTAVTRRGGEDDENNRIMGAAGGGDKTTSSHYYAYVGTTKYNYTKLVDYVDLYYKYVTYVMSITYGALPQLGGTLYDNSAKLIAIMFVAILNFNNIPFLSNLSLFTTNHEILLGEPVFCELNDRDHTIQLYVSKALVTLYLKRATLPNQISYASSLIENNRSMNLGLKLNRLAKGLGRPNFAEQRAQADVKSQSYGNGGGQNTMYRPISSMINRRDSAMAKLNFDANSQNLDNMLLRLFVLADHAATHFLEMYVTGKTDWVNHSDFTKTPFTTTHTLFHINGQTSCGGGGLNLKTFHSQPTVQPIISSVDNYIPTFGGDLFSQPQPFEGGIASQFKGNVLRI